MDDYDIAPGLIYRPFEQMQDLYEKITILGYQQEFVKTAKVRPINSFYFATATNSGEQYYNFVSIAAWLIKKCKRNIAMPQETDDPNMVISGILEHIRSMGSKLETTPSKVKSGCGADVVSALYFLACEALKITGVEWEEVNRDDLSDGEDDVIILEEQEVNLDKIEEEMEQIYSSDEDDEAGWVHQSSNADIGQTDDQMKMLKSDIDTEAWRLEVERVLPQLKITVKTDGHDWRWRQEQMRTHVSGISSMVNQVEVPLKKLVSEAQGISEKVLSRESFLNNQFSGLLDELHQSQEKLSKMKDVHRDLSNKITDKNKSLAQLGDELEQTRRHLEDRGSIMADGAPVVTTRKNLNALKKELGDMEVDIGVMEHGLMKSLVQEQMILRDRNKF